MKKIIYMTGLACILGCGNAGEKSQILIKANQLHLESVSIASLLEKSLDSLGRQANAAERIRLDSLSHLLELWEKLVIEVPGFEHAHEQTEGHQHKPAPQMTDESMLDYQRNAKKAIQEVRIETDRIFKQK